MQKRNNVAFVSLAMFFFAAPAFALNSVNVLADSSLSLAIAEIARDYSRDKDIIVNTSFASPKMQQAQITEGGAADILITPIAPWIETLKTQGLIDIYSPTKVAKNQLALVGPMDSPLKVNLKQSFPLASIIQQIGPDPGFVVGNPETLPEGAYGKEALHNMNVSDYLEPYTLYIKRLDQMFEMVREEKAYGVFFNSTVSGRQGVRVLDLFPANTYQPIQYFAVVIAGENMDEARKFLEYLKTPMAKQVFRDGGFSTE